MTFHPAGRATTAATAILSHRDRLEGASASAPAGRTWSDAVPFEHVDYLARNFERGHVVIAPILDPRHITVVPTVVTLVVTRAQLARLYDGDVTLATKLTDSHAPVHSIGSIAPSGPLAEHNDERVEVTAELAIVNYNDDTPILGFEVVEGTAGA